MTEWKKVFNSGVKTFLIRSTNPVLEIAVRPATVKVERSEPKGNLDRISRRAAIKSKGWGEDVWQKKINRRT